MAKNKEPKSVFEEEDFFSQISSVTNQESEPEVNETGAAETEPTASSLSGKSLTGEGPLRDFFDDNFRQYSAYVICSRAIPAVEDGLKPVQRRILHAMSEIDDGRFTKVANVVGATITYHPHGDASIGDAICVLTNKLWGEGKGYLIEGQGNFGSLYTGMPHAAMRYIECRLSELAKNEVFNKKTTQYVPNYDGRRQEPIYLPSKLPLLLMLGADGIAVGLSTSIFPHNFIELLQAEIAILRKKPFALYPDFQLGGLMDVSDYQDGLGKVTIRARIEKEEKNRIVITELPWGETTESIASSIEDAIRKKKVNVKKLHDLTSDKVRIEVELSPGETQDHAITALYAFTTCEKKLTSRPIVLQDGRPKLMTVSQILQCNVDRLLALLKREFEIRLGELDDLFHARTLERIFIEERLYKRIESEKTYEGVQAAIRDGLKPFLKELRRGAVTDEDIERLLKLQIRRISQFDIDKNRRDIEEIEAEEKQIRDYLVHLKAYAIKYLEGLIKKYSTPADVAKGSRSKKAKDKTEERYTFPRCTEIAHAPFKEVDVRAITATELTIRWDKENNYIGSGLRNGEDVFKCSSLDELILIWKDGRFKKVQPEDKIFVDKNLIAILRYNQEKDRETRDFTCVYEEGAYGFSYIKRFRFGGLIRNKDYRLAPEKPKCKILYFQEGCPETIYVKFKPAKNQRINQQFFQPKEQVERKDPLTGQATQVDVIQIRSASAKGRQLTSKPIARISSAKGAWWDNDEKPSKGFLD